MKYKILPGLENVREDILSNSRSLRANYGKLLTPFERLMIGGTTSKVYEDEKQPEDWRWHTPIVLLGQNELPEDRPSIEEINLIRAAMKFNVSAGLSLLGEGTMNDPALKFKSLAFSLEPIDPVTGNTLNDPKILGVYDPEKDEVIPIDGRDLNREFYQTQKDWYEAHPNSLFSLWRFMRDGRSQLESEAGSFQPEQR